MKQTFQQDCIERARSALQKGQIDRRRLLMAMAATGLLAGASGRALAAEKELIFVGWGGLANDVYQKCYGEPFMQDNPEIAVVQDTAGASPGRIRSMVESGNVTWDICDSSAPVAHMLGKLGMLEPVDYSVVNKDDVISGIYTQEYGATPLAFSSIIAYDGEKYPDGGPQGWADFYDFERFPGRRMMQRDAEVMLDTLQVALGKDPASLYPLDVDACLAKLREIKDQVIFWSSGSESEQIMRSGEADMGIMWQSRAFAVTNDTDGRVKTTWQQGFIQAGSFVIPKGAPLAADAQRLLASMLAKPEPQVEALRLLGTGPTNPKAAELVPKELRATNVLDPENRAVQIELDAAWWGDNYEAVNEKYLEAITS